jgi:hypothetical protein
MQTSTLRPGLLVSLKTSIRGNISYESRDIEPAHLTDDGKQKAVWETRRTIADPDEFERATQVRSRVRTIISAVCARSAFGLLCPENAAENLDRAIAEARRVAEEFNATARVTRVDIFILAGRVSQDDVEAVRAINSEVRDLLADMANGVRNLDVKVVRDAADQARNVGRMLSTDAQARIQVAIDTARNAARKIVQAGEQAAQEIDQQSIRRITEARTAFLDLDAADDIATPTAEARAIDFEPIPELKSAPAPQAASEVE